MSVSHVKNVRFKRSVVTNITGVWPSTDECISHVSVVKHLVCIKEIYYFLL